MEIDCLPLRALRNLRHLDVGVWDAALWGPVASGVNVTFSTSRPPPPPLTKLVVPRANGLYEAVARLGMDTLYTCARPDSFQI